MNPEAKTSVAKEENPVFVLTCEQGNVRPICGAPCPVKECQSSCVRYEGHTGTGILHRCENWHLFN